MNTISPASIASVTPFSASQPAGVALGDLAEGNHELIRVRTGLVSTYRGGMAGRIAAESGAPPDQSSSAATNSSASNGRRSSSPSPTPMKRTGIGPLARGTRIARARWRRSTPPLAVPSSLVRTSPVTPERVVERPHLRQGVLAGVGVEHQQHFVRRARQRLGDHALHLLDFLHQVQLGRQPSRGVGQHDVDAAGDRGIDRVEDHRRRIAGLLRDHGDVVALAPRDQAARAPRRGRCRRRRAAPTCRWPWK